MSINTAHNRTVATCVRNPRRYGSRMASDRPYLRGDYPRETTSVSTWLVCAIAGAFALQFASEFSFFSAANGLPGQFTLSVDALASGRLWAPLTFWLLHSTSNLFHVGLVLLGVHLMGRELTGQLGTRHFVGVFSASLLGGALLWTAFNWRPSGELFGATAALYGLLTVLALLQPGREVSVLLFFFFPVRFRLRHLACAALLVDAVVLFFVEILRQPLPFTYAASSHLGGMLAGWTYFRFLQAAPRPSKRRLRANLPKFALAEATRTQSGRPALAGTAPGGSSGDLRVQVDRVLDKISSQGLGALTSEERKILEAAKNQLKKG